jgi:hypothetical protein
MKNYFTTKYNKRINFVDGYLNSFGNRSDLYKALIEDIYNPEKRMKRILEKKRKHLVGFHNFLPRHNRVVKMKEMLNKYGLFNFNKCLDIGTGHGLIPRLLKAFGIAKEVCGVDRLDRTHYISSKQVLYYEKKLRLSMIADRVLSKIKIKRFDKVFPQSFFNNFGSIIERNQFCPKIVNRNIEMDEFSTQDIYKHKKQYDLITAFACFEYFNATEILNKISALLVDNGVFFLWAANWWHPVNTNQLVGNFPYAANRLERDDWEKYCKEFHKNDADNMIKLHDFFDETHPTVSQYINIANKAGLTLVGYERCILNSPNDIDTFSEENLTSVLSDIHHFRPDVTIEDLLTYTTFMVFKKTTSTRKK